MIVPHGMQPETSSSQALVNFFGTQGKQPFGFAKKGNIVPFHDGFQQFSSEYTRAKRKSDVEMIERGIKDALLLQAELGRHVIEAQILNDGLVDVEADGTKPVNAPYCAYCFDGGDLIMCDHCPASFHSRCIGIPPYENGHFDGKAYCPPCLSFHLTQLVAHLEQLCNASPYARQSKLLMTNIKKLVAKGSYKSHVQFERQVHIVLTPTPEALTAEPYKSVHQAFQSALHKIFATDA